VPSCELRERVADVPLARPRADHEEHAGLLAGADEDVLGPGGSVDEVPLRQPALLAFDEQDALAGEDEEALLLGF
jgi:hypothetical protein